MAPPWEEIYRQDNMTKATFPQVMEFHELLVSVYNELGYRTVEFPFASVQERVAVLITELDSSR